MTSLNDLKTLLYFDVRNNNDILAEMNNIKTRICLYNDLLKLFNLDDIESIKNNLLSINIILDCLYDKKNKKMLNLENNVYGYIASFGEMAEFYYNKLDKILLKLKIDSSLEIDKYDELKKKIIPESKIIIERGIITALKYGQFISDYYKQYIASRLAKEKVSQKEIITILEKVNIHNSRLSSNPNERTNYAELYYLINILNQGYEKIELSSRRNSSLDSFCNNFVQTFDKSNPGVCENLLAGLSFYNDNDLEYIYKRIMFYYQNEMLGIIESLKSEKFYFDKDILNIIKEEYNAYYYRYMLVRNALDILLDKKFNNTNNEDVSPAIKLYYSTNSESPDKCWFIKDLMDIREESLERIDLLLEELKKGISNKLKPLKGIHGFSEIKDDQIRIVFKPIGADSAVILGVFIKKDNNDPLFKKIIARPIPDLNDEYSASVEEYYKNYIKENSRKGLR